MVFTTPEYALFLLACVHLYLRLRHSRQNAFLLAASYAFYAFWDYRFLSLILVSTAVDFIAGLSICAARQRNHRARMKLALAASLMCNLGLLGTFKYYDFFVISANDFLVALGGASSLPTLQVILPVGISFYTFQTLSYTIDIYRGDMEPVRNPIDFALFVAFFPQLVAGPIERARRLLPQIQRPRHVVADDFRSGLWLILLGLVRKIVIADTAGLWVDRYFLEPHRFSSLELLAGLFLYGIQIYGDFSGYSNIARGSARLLGFSLTRNFEHPFFSTSLADFWRRWHISLSSWLRDYLYFPLGGSRRGQLRTALNLMVTMLLAGLWHGASVTIVLWGLAHGIYLASERLLRSLRDTLPTRVPVWLNQAGGLMMTTAFVTLAWILFRATDLENFVAFSTQLAQLSPAPTPRLLPLVVLGGLTLAIDVPQAVARDELAVARLGLVRQSALAGCLIILVFLGGSLGKPFIYFQF